MQSVVSSQDGLATEEIENHESHELHENSREKRLGAIVTPAEFLPDAVRSILLAFVQIRAIGGWFRLPLE